MSEHQPSPGDFTREDQPATSSDLVAYLTTYGDWGNRCMSAWSAGEPWWSLHVEHCAECRAVQAASEKAGAA